MNGAICRIVLCVLVGIIVILQKISELELSVSYDLVSRIVLIL